MLLLLYTIYFLCYLVSTVYHSLFIENIMFYPEINKAIYFCFLIEIQINYYCPVFMEFIIYQYQQFRHRQITVTIHSKNCLPSIILYVYLFFFSIVLSQYLICANIECIFKIWNGDLDYFVYNYIGRRKTIRDFKTVRSLAMSYDFVHASLQIIQCYNNNTILFW